ncbi:glycoside hydrolase family 99-like domain-containing protein [Larkinella soli]|uniref:glycoside hydrolase family 99-like domain-containing protein n=1 Tax=Larkinella soli TaxID=1770527 RepID=UPI0013E30815|nr:glycoside hydrolase family 99-like domain-containing protein [Larkinella soli]
MNGLPNRFPGGFALILLIFCVCAGAILPLSPTFRTPVKKDRPRVGVYYFDGWSGLTRGHLTQTLIDSFPEREPIWGWITSKKDVMQAQINTAADAGIDFFSFCWYKFPADKANFRQHPLNHALNLFLQAPNRNRLKFCLLVANHGGSVLGPADWEQAAGAWIELFQKPEYYRVDGKPLLIFFNLQTLLDRFGGSAGLRDALASLRARSAQAGVPEVTVAVCVRPEQAQMAEEAGFNWLTGYNYHEAGFTSKDKVIPIDSLIAGSRALWDQFRSARLPYSPVVTLNWDPRPWAQQSSWYAQSQRYSGFSSLSVYKAVRSAVTWTERSPEIMSDQRMILIYAWNEYGEGAWLTPSKQQKDDLLTGLKAALR